MPAIWGSQHIETARTLLYARLTELVTQMAGYDPTFVAAHDHHLVAALRLNAVTVGLDAAASDYTANGQAEEVDWRLVFSVRVHTAYAGTAAKDPDDAQLMASVVNKLQSKMVLSNSPEIYIAEISSVRTGVEFSSSATIGAECLVMVKTVVGYTQE